MSRLAVVASASALVLSAGSLDGQARPDLSGVWTLVIEQTRAGRA